MSAGTPRLSVRIPRELRALLKEEAKQRSMSETAIILEALRTRYHRDERAAG